MKQRRRVKLAACICFLLPFVGSAFACPDIDGLVDVNCDKKLEIVAFGDSITFGRGDLPGMGGYPKRLTQYFPHAIVSNYGVPGERTPTGKLRANSAFRAHAADYIVVLEGVNDFFEENFTAPMTVSNLLTMIRTGRATGAVTLLANLTEVTRSLQKSWVKSVNTAIGIRSNINFYSLGPTIIGWDRVHPSSFGYDAIAKLAAGALYQMSNRFRPLDSDNDGVYDWKERQMGTNPYRSDSDNDGLTDGQEFILNTNAGISDSDGDGISDKEEIDVVHTDPNDPKITAPTIRSYRILN